MKGAAPVYDVNQAFEFFKKSPDAQIRIDIDDDYILERQIFSEKLGGYYFLNIDFAYQPRSTKRKAVFREFNNLFKFEAHYSQRGNGRVKSILFCVIVVNEFETGVKYFSLEVAKIFDPDAEEKTTYYNNHNVVKKSPVAQKKKPGPKPKAKEKPEKAQKRPREDEEDNSLVRYPIKKAHMIDLVSPPRAESTFDQETFENTMREKDNKISELQKKIDELERKFEEFSDKKSEIIYIM